MTNYDIIVDAIEDLERKEITFAIASKLADLYIIRDHMNEGTQTMTVATVSELEPEQPKTEFMLAVQKVGASKAWLVMDELMTTLQAVNKRLYDGVMRQLTGD